MLQGRASSSTLFTLGACLACWACSPANPDADPGATAVQGRNVTLYYHPDAVPCAGTLPYLDTNVDAIAAYFGITPVTPIPYHYRQDLPCPLDSVGCAVATPGEPVTLWSTTPYSVHELVHAVQMPKKLSTSFLLEAQAVALGEGTYGQGPTGLSDAQLLQPTQLPGDDYPVAGDFGSYLLTRFGPAQFESLLASLSWASPTDVVETAFSGVYGETMTQLRADRAMSDMVFPYDRIGLTECLALPVDQALGQGMTVSESLDCTTNGVGTVGASAFRYVPFDIANDGLYQVDVVMPASSGASLTLSGCGMTTWLGWGQNETVSSSSVVVGYFLKGRYTLQLGTPSDDAVSFTVTVQPLATGSPPGCSSVPALTVPPGTKQIFLFSMVAGPLEVPFVTSSAATAVSWLGLSSQVDVCTGGCDQGCAAAATPSPALQADVPFALKAQIVTPDGTSAGGFVAVDIE